MAGCSVHMLSMSLIHWATRKNARTDDKLFWKNGQVFYQCLINGISDLYVYTSIVSRETKEKDNIEENPAVWEMAKDVKRMLVNLLICSENVAILVGAYLRPKELGIPTEFLVAVLAIHIAGLLLMVIKPPHLLVP